MPQLIAANWKMNGRLDWVDKVGELAALTGEAVCERLICPPHPLVGAMARAAQGSGIAIGAQDCSEHEAGAHTGETEAALLAALGARYVILGHSERRTGGETDDRVKAKAERAVGSGLRPLVCVGESLAEREAGTAIPVVEAQLSGSLPQQGDYDIAYEPVWAIGTGRTATARDVAEMHAAIRRHVGVGPRILYGGSVKPDNAALLLGVPEVGGALVGGASLEMESFAQIVHAAKAD
ncbi:triose-phosphate isomerase [uncultured Algimonas sp.]|uniref:triose-phosphate isomerase n=1 Tax=uncultured Algimonas sp. TaxID=1547920 RepID=UPI00263948EF|nr:triose-phosphate isomerase [uncultured Algimonas sp.]